MFVCLSVGLPVCQFVNLSVCQSASQPASLPINQRMKQPVSLSNCQPVRMSVCLSAKRNIHVRSCRGVLPTSTMLNLASSDCDRTSLRCVTTIRSPHDSDRHNSASRCRSRHKVDHVDEYTIHTRPTQTNQGLRASSALTFTTGCCRRSHLPHVSYLSVAFRPTHT